ncbi:MAG TPA: TIGR03087 family PEP-CTERM/XrtA system glycosyltransferase [Thiobacillus sp.]|nr:MAG: sugar transferase [Hydrogenophilales bacterium 28-61-11]OYZ58918.1 MAG: sugar transferase [Hydrogenophilales bacterium 16-61-112]OZA46970.1 MAG: sugar transferase [Hydrogenophilales bacterium 17-61-76]HQT30391.1 TIGR03087 family PEP-CTERM/XrtA system glycosyltransferase [Thiobacillus sp.]HQT68997.1 TIGR03087 family PEP-CTERM/XrtA system glycosyltransferase [Thiobacillus sp.]
MDGLLFLAHRIPFPPNKGDKIRSFHLLRHLSTRYVIHLGAFVDDADDWQFQDALKPYCASIKLLPLNPRRARLASLTGLFSGEALTLPYYRNRELTQWAAGLAASGTVTRGLAYSSAMAMFMPPMLARRVIDMVDVDSDKWTQYASTQRWPMSWVYAREGRKLADWEARVAQDFDATLLVSPDEAALLQQRVPQARDQIGAFENGVDADYFSPARDYPNPYSPEVQGVVFTGAMDYWPNVDAVSWFAERIFPAIRDAAPAAQFAIVGSRPSAAVLALGRQPGVIVTGSVPDVRPWLAHAKCAVAPLRIARGVQNKVLEAMAMARPVVVSAQAAEGIRAEAGRDFILAHGEAEFAQAVVKQLQGASSAAPARACILAHYDWAASLRRIDPLFEPVAVQPPVLETYPHVTPA